MSVDTEFELAFVKVTEEAAVAAAQTMGWGDRNESDRVAVEAMRKTLDHLEIAGRVAACGPVAVQAVKKSLVTNDGRPAEDALARSLEIGQPVFKSKDAIEGPTAFMEKRKPNFKGE